ncbi:hypothetical protein MRB53_019750 [Persea americana]|uniref:Uncharacterized protein n=1 Tax=Persea americana TaxID=3435 RepID=A0ACC2L099_PERAE|nr:hypothetical protein MRB53_019750 [Persea americana]
MSTLEATRAELTLLVLYLNKAEARDKICRAIQYGSKFFSNGEPGGGGGGKLHWGCSVWAMGWTSWAVEGTDWVIMWRKLGTVLGDGEEVRAAEEDDEVADEDAILQNFGDCLWQLKKLEKDLKQTDKYQNDQYLKKLKQSNDRLLALVRSSMDIVVAVGLLQLAPKKVTPSVTGAFGFITSLISCYQLLPPQPKAKVP